MPPPTIRSAGISLCPDTSDAVWQHILMNPAAVNGAQKACAAWRHHLKAHLQLPLVLRSFASIDAVATFRCVHTLDAKDVEWLDSDGVGLLPATMPALQRVDLSGCVHVSSIGVKRLVKGLGARLLEFRQDVTPKHNLCKDMVVTEATLKAIAAAPNLQTLSLTLGSKVKSGLEHLTGNKSLQTLSLFFEGFTPLALPHQLPALRHLNIKTGTFSRFPWPQNVFQCVDFCCINGRDSRFPNIQTVTIDDAIGRPSGNTRGLRGEFVYGMACGFLCPITVKRVGTASDITEELPWTCTDDTQRFTADDGEYEPETTDDEYEPELGDNL